MTAGLPANGDEHLVYCGHQSSLTSVRGKALPIHAAELRLSNGTVLRKEVDADASSAQFDVELPAGPLDIEAWLLDKQGERLTGAYYVDAFAR